MCAKPSWRCPTTSTRSPPRLTRPSSSSVNDGCRSASACVHTRPVSGVDCADGRRAVSGSPDDRPHRREPVLRLSRSEETKLCALPDISRPPPRTFAASAPRTGRNSHAHALHRAAALARAAPPRAQARRRGRGPLRGRPPRAGGAALRGGRRAVRARREGTADMVFESRTWRLLAIAHLQRAHELRCRLQLHDAQVAASERSSSAAPRAARSPPPPPTRRPRRSPPRRARRRRRTLACGSS